MTESAFPTSRGRRPLVVLFGGLSACIVGAPLIPALTPDWPRSGILFPFFVSIAVLLPVLFYARTRGPAFLTPTVLVFSGLLPLYSIYTGNGRVLTSGDNLATRALPSRMLQAGTVDLSKVSPFDGPDLPYSVVRLGGRVLNAYPSGTAFIALPYGLLGLAGSGGVVDRGLISRWDKHASAILTIAAVAFFYAAARRFGPRAALGATAVFALATPLPTAPAQSLWSFTGEGLCLAIALYGLLGARARPWMAGAAMGAAFACRPTAVVSAIVFMLASALGERKTAVHYGVSMALTVSAVAAWQFALYGHPLGAYGIAQTAQMGSRLSGEALLGVLFSPSRGLVIYFPYVLLAPVAAAILTRRREPEVWRWWWASMVLIAAAVLMAASHAQWWGGWSLGPRLMAECAPFLALATVPLWMVGGWGRRVLLALFFFSASTQLLLAYNPAASDWNSRVHSRMRSRSLAGLRESQLLAAWVPGWVDRHFGFNEPRSLTGPDAPELMGSIGPPKMSDASRDELALEGWARIPGEDLDVFFFLDGAVTRPAAIRRVPRPDVSSVLPSLGDCATAGFEAVLRFQGATGPHDLYAIVRARDGRIHRLEERRFQWMQ